MPFLLNTLVLLNHKFGKCKKSASGWQNVQTAVTEKVINVRTKCISIKGALTVPFNKAVAQKLYYCSDSLCITNRPPCINMRLLLELTFGNDITDYTFKTFSFKVYFNFIVVGL